MSSALHFKDDFNFDQYLMTDHTILEQNFFNVSFVSIFCFSKFILVFEKVLGPTQYFLV